MIRKVNNVVFMYLLILILFILLFVFVVFCELYVDEMIESFINGHGANLDSFT